MRNLLIVLVLASFTALLSSGCGERSHLAVGDKVTVRLVTDYVAPLEVARAEVEIFRAPRNELRKLVARVDTTLLETMPLSTGIDAATLRGIADGTYEVDVVLKTARDEFVAQRRVAFEVVGQTTVTVIITASCKDVACGDGSSCHNGTCIDERCRPETPEHCGDSLCSVDGDCSTESTCASAACVLGACLEIAREGSCEADEQCVRERDCVPRTPVEEPRPDSRCGLVCTLDGDPCRYGYWVCDETSIVCTPFLQRPAGSSCGDGLVCDAFGECTPDGELDGGELDGGAMDGGDVLDGGRDARVDSATDAGADATTGDLGSDAFDFCNVTVYVTTQEALEPYLPCTYLAGLVASMGDNTLYNVTLPNLQRAGYIQFNGDNHAMHQLSLPALTRVDGDLSINYQSELTNVDLRALESIGGNFTVYSNYRLVVLDASALESIGGNFWLNNVDVIDLDLGALESVGDDFNVVFNARLATMTLTSLFTVGEDVDVSANPYLCRFIPESQLDPAPTSFSFTRGVMCPPPEPEICDTFLTLTTNEALEPYLPCTSLRGIEGDGSSEVTALSLPNLRTVTQGIALNGENDTLITVSLPALQSVGEQLTISWHSSLTSIDLGALETIGSDSAGLQIYANGSLASLDLSSLESLAGQLYVSGGSFEELDLSSLESVGGAFQVFGNANLRNLPAPRLTEAATVYVNDNPRLCRLFPPTQIPDATSYTFDRGITCPDCNHDLYVTTQAALEPYLECETLPALIIDENSEPTSITFPYLRDIYSGGLKIEDNDTLESVSFPALETASELWISNNEVLTGFSAPQLSSSRGMNLIHNDAIVTFSLPSLAIFNGGWLFINNNLLLEDVHLRALTTVSSNMFINDNAALNEVDVPRLTSVVASVFVQDNPQLCWFPPQAQISTPMFNVTLDPSCAPVDCDVDLVVQTESDWYPYYDCTSLRSVTAATAAGLGRLWLPNLQSVSGSIAVTGNDALTYAGFISLDTVGGSLTIEGNDALSLVELWSLGQVDVALSVEGNAMLCDFIPESQVTTPSFSFEAGASCP